MQEPYWWYVLYVRTNTEHKVVNSFQRAYIQKGVAYDLEVFCPESERFYKDKQTKTFGKQFTKRPLFPGYVFVETNMPSKEFRNAFYEVIWNSADIIKLLRYGDSDEIALSLEERCRFEYLMKGKRCIEHSIGFIVGDRIVVQAGGLIGMEGHIIKINRHNRTADVEIQMFNQKISIKVALEIVSRQN